MTPLTLFQNGKFILRSGAESRWKIECDALTPHDWQTLAIMAAEILPPFRMAVGVPRGGLMFALALNEHATGDDNHAVLIAEDVVTTGGSIERFAEANKFSPGVCMGVCVFARGTCPGWILPLFVMNGKRGSS